MNKRTAISTLIITALICAASVYADVSLRAPFKSHAVFQRGIKIPVWGTADPGEKVTVEFAKQKASTVADSAGKWAVKFKPVDAGGPYEMVVKGNNEIDVTDILMGDVWICSGQSNMEFGLGSAVNAQQEIADADYPEIRLITINKKVADEPQENAWGTWSLCSPKSVGWFTAVGYFFGRELHKELKVPIGLIHSSWGGTPAEVWTSREMLESDPSFKSFITRWDRSLETYNKAKERYQENLIEWETEAESARIAGDNSQLRARPKPPAQLNAFKSQPSCLFNGMINPIIPYGIRGVIWYQGESNADNGRRYSRLFPAMIQDWRTRWGQGNFAFLFVQLANFMPVQKKPSEGGWADLREAQLQTFLTFPKTGMASAVDIGDANDIHPKNKQDVGRRLALAALGIEYGKKIEYSGPIYDTMTVEGNKIRLKFKHTGTGLAVKEGEELKGFAIAGDNKTFKWANVQIDGNTVLAWNDEIEVPVIVRYGWANNPIGNLYNKEGLPASPFRTDSPY